jgi:hypothetical protein
MTHDLAPRQAYSHESMSSPRCFGLGVTRSRTRRVGYQSGRSDLGTWLLSEFKRQPPPRRLGLEHPTGLTHRVDREALRDRWIANCVASTKRGASRRISPWCVATAPVSMGSMREHARIGGGAAAPHSNVASRVAWRLSATRSASASVPPVGWPSPRRLLLRQGPRWPAASH